MRLRNLAAAAAILLPVVGIGGTAIASDGGEWRKVPISFTASEGTLTPSADFVCDSTNQCVYLATETGGTLNGDLQGQGVQALAATAPNTASLIYISATGTFVGTVKVCGSGTFVYRGTSTLNLATGDFEVIWTVAPGSGTGDLVGSTGTFAQRTGMATAEGWVRCKVKTHG